MSSQTPEPEALPTICVVVPVLNGATTIGACVDSLLAQRYPAGLFEVIVVDNGSLDSTCAEVARCPVRLVRCAEPGPSAARNLGVHSTNAEIVAFTDADCVADPDWLRELAAAFEDPAASGAGGPIDALRHDGRSIVERFGDECRPLVNFEAAGAEYLPRLYGANAAYRRQLLLDVGGWDESLLMTEDVELSWRLQLRTGTTLVYRPRAAILHHHRDTLRRLARQYWIYGLGEAFIDSMFRNQPSYPRPLSFYPRRLASQVAAIGRSLAAGAKRVWLLWRGRTTPYEAARPWLWLLVEASNVAGKVQGVVLTRGLRKPEPLRLCLRRWVPRGYKVQTPAQSASPIESDSTR